MEKLIVAVLFLSLISNHAYADNGVPKEFKITLHKDAHQGQIEYQSKEVVKECEPGNAVRVIGIVKEPKNICISNFQDSYISKANVLAFVSQAVNEAGGITSDSSLSHAYIGFLSNHNKFHKWEVNFNKGSVNLPGPDIWAKPIYHTATHKVIFIDRNYLSLGQKVIDLFGTICSAALPFTSGLIIGNAKK